MDWDWYLVLVVVHVMTAIIGIGPAFFAPVLLRSGQPLDQLRHSFRLGAILELFPKIGGTIAVLSGIGLVIAGDYQFKDVWIYASIAIYVIIQILMVGFAAPAQKRVFQWLFNQALEPSSNSVPVEYRELVARIHLIHYVATVFGIILFILMIVKPTF
ncbi:DUF2269 family protein [Paenibacillus kobensis]|uniref:DUF2269 family protein n=1 Tax=Paenibacillus kobensis TaxID=59841 RepID=UPI0013E2C4CA|nr:DUF2269 family protein [Paenibacillus kobensis]